MVAYWCGREAKRSRETQEGLRVLPLGVEPAGSSWVGRFGLEQKVCAGGDVLYRRSVAEECCL
ncbi:hypothetical protein MPNT_270005 [Candidatus Methylacidithermus pantelleriae]|uniref:Uncharacterized protein n=1 Tax=Candidatus Methylacidithermus pantelleriae TaxID=2744239 RepID=A0A8J2BL49_9BACT|nr:hypothetical protein MPNT_270005 [Candidatus Methylacidithermus pantelleriae]